MAPKKKQPEPQSRGLTAADTAAGDPPPAVTELAEQIASDGGAVLAHYREPFGEHWQILGALPIDKVEPTPFQRNLSKTHAARLGDVIDKLGRFVDPIVAMRTPAGNYWTPNGGHRLEAMKKLGAKSIIALIIPEAEVAYQILALNTEKAHSLGEKCLEVIRMARSLAEDDEQRREQDCEFFFEDPAYATLGCCYEQVVRFSGSAYTSVLKRLEGFFDLPMAEALAIREQRAQKVLALDAAVAAAVDGLKEAGFVGSALKGFVIKAVNPLAEAKRGETADFDATIDAMTAAAEGFDPEAVDTAGLPTT